MTSQALKHLGKTRGQRGRGFYFSPMPENYVNLRNLVLAGNLKAQWIKELSWQNIKAT